MRYQIVFLVNGIPFDTSFADGVNPLDALTEARLPLGRWTEGDALACLVAPVARTIAPAPRGFSAVLHAVMRREAVAREARHGRLVPVTLAPPAPKLGPMAEFDELSVDELLGPDPVKPSDELAEEPAAPAEEPAEAGDDPEDLDALLAAFEAEAEDD